MTTVNQDKTGSDAAPLRRQAEALLRQAIVSGKFFSGERLREKMLMEMVGVSRTSLREALRQIEAEGLIRLEANRGVVVASMSYEEVEQIYDARGVLEALACKRFAENASQNQVEELRKICDELMQAVAADDPARALDVKRAFYGLILEGCGNIVVRQMLTQINNRIGMLRGMTLSEPDRLPDMGSEVRQIVDAIAIRDSERAWSASLHHVRRAARIALRIVRNEEKGQSSRKPPQRHADTAVRSGT